MWVPEIKAVAVTNTGALLLSYHPTFVRVGRDFTLRPLVPMKYPTTFAPGTASEVVASPEIKMTAVGFSARK
jgi:hypothetical protein